MLTTPWKAKRDPNKRSDRGSDTTTTGDSTTATNQSSNSLQTESPKDSGSLEVIVPARYLCFICGKLLRDAVQLPTCGHRFCKHCFEDLARKPRDGATLKCPRDGNPIDRSKVFEDLGWMQTILELTVRCPHETRGCTWLGLVRGLEAHLEQCAVSVKQTSPFQSEHQIEPIANTKRPEGTPLRREDVEESGESENEDDENIEVLLDQMDELETRVDSLLYEVNATKTGKLLWQISTLDSAPFSPELEEQEVESKLVRSDFIYTGEYGYKLQAIAYPTGTASGRGTHLSLYIMIHSGRFDAILPWPFKQKVTFTLLEFGEGSKLKYGKREELIGDRDSQSFLRPSSEPNPGWGFPQFVALDEMRNEQHMRNGSVFVLVEVESIGAMDFIHS